MMAAAWSTPGWTARGMMALLTVVLGACVAPAPPASLKFEPSTRSKPDPADARVHRFEMVSKAPASWIEADVANEEFAGPLCPDGENWDFVAISPMTRPGEVTVQQFPAGTLFSRTWRCAAKYPGELTFSRKLTVAEAHDLVQQALTSQSDADSAVEAILFDAFGDEELKYDLVEKHIGDAVADAIATCGERPIRMHAPVIGEWETDAKSVAGNKDQRAILFGVRIDCDGEAPAGDAPRD